MRILVTGGTGGLGAAMAVALADDGHEVVITGRDDDRARRAAGELPGAITGLGMDVRDEASIRACRDRIGPVDVLINNAGIGMRTVNPGFLTEPQPFWQVSPAGFRDVVDTNLTGYFLVARTFVPDMVAAGRGRVINVSMNHTTMVRAGFVPYGPSRAGAEALSRIMAAELADTGVRVNMLLPGGATRTGMVPDEARHLPNLLEPDVMAAPARWLCSPDAADVHDERIVATEFAEWLTARQR
jgi:NAD(P)-dependent dehydrogenase (short-subunit alcohol dehydrogenase family)